MMHDAHKTGQLLQNAMILSLWNIQQNMGEDAYNKNSVHWLKNFTRDDCSRYSIIRQEAHHGKLTLIVIWFLQNICNIYNIHPDFELFIFFMQLM